MDKADARRYTSNMPTKRRARDEPDVNQIAFRTVAEATGTARHTPGGLAPNPLPMSALPGRRRPRPKKRRDS